MKNFKLIIILTIISLISLNSFSQGFFITKSGDTIQNTKTENRYPNLKYWINGVKKPKKIKLSEVELIVDDYPMYLSFKKNEVDEFTGNLNRLTETVRIGKKENHIYVGLKIFMGKVESSNNRKYYLYVNPISDLGCSGSNKNYLMVKFINNSVIKIDNDISEVDCSEMNTISIYLINNEVLNKLKSNEIKSIRIQQSKFYKDFDIVFPDYFIKTIRLLDRK